MINHDYINCKAKKENKALPVIATIIMIVVVLITISRGIDKTIESQDRMLCRSAKITNNKEYTAKCQCFYQGEDISCIAH